MASQHRVQELFDRVARGGQQGVIEYLHGLANTTQTTTGQLLGAMRDDIGRSALHIAARHGDVEMVKLLLGPVLFAADPGAQELFAHSTSISGDTALIWAVRSGQVDVVLELYLQGLAEPDHHNRLGSTAIHIAASLGNQEMISTLLDIGGEVSMRNAAGKTALHLVARQNNFQLIRQLINAGVALNAIDIQGYTALHRATTMRHGAAVLALLARGADANLPNNLGETALATALRIVVRGESTGGVLGALLQAALQARS